MQNNIIQKIIKITATCILFFLSIQVNSGCSRDNTTNNIRNIDLTKQIIKTLEEGTEYIDFRADQNAGSFLLSGWKTPTEKFTPMRRFKSSLFFYNYNLSQNIEPICTIIPVAVETGPYGILTISINNASAHSLTLTAESSPEISFIIPASLLKLGMNTMTFQFKFSPKSPEISQAQFNKLKKKRLGFVSIDFRKKSYVNFSNKRNILQYADSEYSFLKEMPAKFNLQVQYESNNNANSSMEISSENNDKIIITLPSKRNSIIKNISLKSAGPVKFRFSTHGQTSSYTSWNKILVSTDELTQENQKKEVYQKKTTKRPNIFLYVIDTLRADHLHCYGYEKKTSPNIDQFAKNNTLFTNAFSNASWTKPSGASLLTGLFPKHHKAITRGDKLPDRVHTLSESLQAAGYDTAAFISNGHLTETFGFNQGFNSFIDLSGNKGDDDLAGGYLSDDINESVLAFLQKYSNQNQKPLFMLVWTIDPHAPYAPRDNVKNLFDIDQYEPVDTYNHQLLDKIRKKELTLSKSQIEYVKTRYDQEIYFNDSSFGDFISMLKQKNLYDHSITIFTSDHGEEFYDHDNIGHSRTLYNEQIRVPLIIKGNSFPKGTINNSQTQHIDILPTIIDILKLETPYTFDGSSMLASKDSTRTLFFEQKLDDIELSAILSPNKKVIFNKSIRRNLGKQTIPVFEVYSSFDVMEKNEQGVNNLNDELNIQKMLFYRKNFDKNKTFQKSKATIPKSLDERLKALGYAR